MSIRAMSYGAGVQSTAMLVLAARKEIDFPLALFSNVGDNSEHPKSLAYFNEVAMPYAVANGIELVELRKRPKGRERDLYTDLMSDVRSIGIPVYMSGSGAPGRRNCTSEYKIKRVAFEMKARGASKNDPAVLAMGISLDEFQRMRNASGYDHYTLDYPLINLRMDRQACIRLIESEGIPVPPKSSCYFCPFTKIATWQERKRDEPELFAKAVVLEQRLNEKRAILGKDKVWLTGMQIPLDEAIRGGQITMDIEPTCDIAGFCGT